MWASRTNYKEPDEPTDIVDELRAADLEQRKQIEGAMIIHGPDAVPGARSLLERAADEIEKLRAVIGLLEN